MPSSDGRVLGAVCKDLAAYQAEGGGRALDIARQVAPQAVIDAVTASGLRGRGGAGFPTGRKWSTVVANRSPDVPTTVVVNAAEGEPGSFKDRAILRANPYRVLEGALVAAVVVGADRVIVAAKASFTQELQRLRRAADEMRAAGWADGPRPVGIEVFAGPDEYLYGEETALLEVLDGRAPFPRIAPPFRHGVDELGDGTLSPADVAMAGPGPATPAPPTLVNNTETMANVPGIVTEGPDWFRSMGTPESPGTMVFTVTGSTRVHGVAELPLGTPLNDVFERVGGGARIGHRLVAALSGVAHPLLPADLFATPASYEALEAVGGGLGAAGFIVFDDKDDLAAVAAGVSRFLAVESCGQCTPCKQDGRAIADLLAGLCAGEADEHDLAAVADHVATVADEARCFLAHQHQRVIESLLRLFPDQARAHLAGGAARPVQPAAIAPIVDLVDGAAVLDSKQAAKQPDWTYGGEDSGQSPADRIDQGLRVGP